MYYIRQTLLSSLEEGLGTRLELQLSIHVKYFVFKLMSATGNFPQTNKCGSKIDARYQLTVWHFVHVCRNLQVCHKLL